MSDKAATADSKLDYALWAAVFALVAVGVAGNSYFASESLLYRVIGLVVLAVAAGWLAGRTAKGRAFIQLGVEARTEIRKVVWPTGQETAHTTMIVVVVVLIVAIILWALDSTLSWLISLVIGS
ncbi:MAG: preprotein translocase subunit SecE [Pseudomonadota bacterium]|nr:preprotein translocase subunit SecE [Pseudomonadota bacterium]